MNFGNTLRNGQKAIIVDAEKKFGRSLKKYEQEFIASCGSFSALEMIRDTILVR